MSDARNKMKQVQMRDMQENFEDVLMSGGPVKILRDTGNAILVSEEIWCGVTETLSPLSICDTKAR